MYLQELKGRYSRLERIKKGGQKTVFRAEGGSEPVALKLIHCPNDPRVMQEIEIMKGLVSRYIPKIIESGNVVDETDGETLLYIIEEYIHGDSLRDWLAKGNTFDLKIAYQILFYLIEIEIELEELKILHRDINPNNIILLNNGEIRLIDFGLAKIIGGLSLTKTAAINGPFTPGYAPHEQIANIKLNQDVRTDLFQIGVTIYEALSGKNPFVEQASGLYDIMSRTMTLMPPTLNIGGDTKGMFSQFINMLMAKNQSQRPDTAQQAMKYLLAIQSSLEIEG